MQFIPEEIVRMIRDKNINAQSKSIIIVNGFERLDLYFDIAEAIKRLSDADRFSVTIKLAKRKWEKLSKISDSSTRLRMEQNGYVADKESVTFYRNCYDTNLLVLLGTEEEEDTGGLRNCYTIRPQTLVKELGDNYDRVFESCFVGDLGKEDRDCVKNAYRHLFHCFSVDICKLNDIADKWDRCFSTISELLLEFSKNLPDWGLPPRIHEPFKKKDLNTSLDKSPISVEHKFISGKMYQKLNRASYGRLETNLEKYAENADGKYADVNWEDYGFNDFQDFSDTLLAFARSENFQHNKERLLKVDFSIINDILKFKPKSESAPKKSSETNIPGSPLDVILRSVLMVLKKCKAEKLDQEISEIHFAFNGATINTGYADSNTEDKTELLANAWKNICVHVHGIFDFLNSPSSGFLGGKTKIVCDNPEFFDPKCIYDQIEASLLTVVSEKNHLDKIAFSVFLADNNGNVLCKDDESSEEISYSFKWCFDSEASWLFDFRDLAKEESFLDSGAVRIPVGVFGSLYKTMFVKSQEEFFDLFAEENINLSYDLCSFVREEAANYSDSVLSSLCDKFDELGKVFCRFVFELNSSGFYHVLCGSLLEELNAKYIDLIDTVLSTKFDENKQWFMDAVLQAFCILDCTTYIKKCVDLCYVIVPPWHPAALQKLAAQKRFILDGVNSELFVGEDNHLSYPSVKELDHLIALAEIPSFVDVFPAKGNDYIGIFNTYGHYCIYANEKSIKASAKIRMKDILRKEAIYDEDFKDNVLTTVNDNGQMIYDILMNYNKAMPSTQYSLRLVFINPIDLQPIISAVHKYVNSITKGNDSPFLDLKLTIFTRSENNGGRNCLSYWMDNFFPEEQNTKIHVYLNEWSTKKDLVNLLTENNDIVFNMNVLHEETFTFIANRDSENSNISECSFPILYKPSPISQTSTRRRIEITQTQFDASFKLSQVAYYKKNSAVVPQNAFLAVRDTSIDDETREIIGVLHKKAYWVVCIDRVMDGALLRQGNNKDYSIIGFSTGKGLNGQYNITITTRNSILEVVKKKLKKRLHRLFNWEDEILTVVSDNVMEEARSLDGISVFSAINQNGHNINEFMAYVMTSLREAQFKADSALKVIVHLDSYKHWFDNSAKEDETSSRPDFLMLSAAPSGSSVKLKATVIECKTAGLVNYTPHIEKAKSQIRHGLSQLSRLFDPASDAIDRRYWYAQLYRALVFAQVTFSDSTDEFQDLSEKLRSILDGNFEIEWEGKIIGYWLDMEGEEEQHLSEEGISICNVPQARIKSLLTKNKIHNFVTIAPEIIKEMDDLEDASSTPVQDIEPEEPTAPSKPLPKTTTPSVEPPQPPAPVSAPEEPVEPSPAQNNIEDIRILIGKDRAQNDVYWEFGNKNLANRHLLITGISGQGKTYAIQTMMYEASKHNVSIIVFDYTQGFTEKQLDPKFVSKLDGHMEQKVVYNDGVPISPFIRHEIEVSGLKLLEKPEDVALRISYTLSHQYKTMGDQQRNAIYNACISCLNKLGENMTMQDLKSELAAGDNYAHTALTKLQPFFDMVKFINNPDYDWGKILYNEKSRLTVFQLAGFHRDMQLLITEFLLWDLWNYAMKFGTKEQPFIVVLDEAQNIDHSENSPSGKILTEGRKFGWSAWYATQSLSTLNPDEVSRLQNSAFKIYFKPNETDVKEMSKYIDPTNANEWTEPLSTLKKGECIVVGDRIQKDGKFRKGRPAVTSVVSFEDRQ